MRISDWSSDVCSSDLLKPLLKPVFGVRKDRLGRAFRLAHTAIDAFIGVDDQHVLALVEAIHGANLDAIHIFAADAGVGDHIGHGRNSFIFPFGIRTRSEEHTSELQSLMRISYAVFCLKKK